MFPCGGEMAKKWVVGQFPITALIGHHDPVRTFEVYLLGAETAVYLVPPGASQPQDLFSAQPLRGPIRCHGHPRLRCIVENEYQGPSLLSTGNGKPHRLTSGHDHTHSFFSNLFAFRRF